MNIKLTVFFDSIFWVGVFEQTADGKYKTAKIVFGAEPKDQEIYDLVIRDFTALSFSRPLTAVPETAIHKINPKRLQRMVRKEVETTGVGTKAQLALSRERETRKEERKATVKIRKEAAAMAKFILRQEKRKQKKKGH